MTERHTSFPKSSRLKLASDFRDLLKNGESFRENGLVIYFRKSNLFESRLGIIMSRRAWGRAVERNRAKRIIREEYRKGKTNFTAPYDLIVKVVNGYNLLESNKLQLLLNGLFRKIKC